MQVYPKFEGKKTTFTDEDEAPVPQQQSIKRTSGPHERDVMSGLKVGSSKNAMLSGQKMLLTLETVFIFLWL